jgi:hypothetical protein
MSPFLIMAFLVKNMAFALVKKPAIFDGLSLGRKTDLLLTNSYDELVSDVTDIKDLGSGVIGGVECDYLAFRKKEVDFQIWIAQGSKPYPCRLSITSHMVPGGPQYSIQLRDWKTGGEAEKADFAFKNTSNAAKVEMVEVREKFSDLPTNFSVGGGK